MSAVLPGAVLASSAAVVRYYDRVLKQRELVSHGSEGGRSRIRLPASVAPGGQPSCCLHVAEAPSCVSSWKGTAPHRGTHPQDLVTS